MPGQPPPTSLAARIAALAGQPVAALRPLHGGDLSQVSLATLADGSRVVAKRHARVEAEARMLETLAEAQAPVPRVLATGEQLMLLEALEETGPSPEGWRALGTALATLHARHGAHFGWPEDYGFGPASIPNAPADTWPSFWAERRLMAWPEALPADIARRTERAAAELPALLPAHPPPAHLHGDLWSGNVVFNGPGAALVDPACYHGHAEVDLAMLTLFGRPDPSFYESYGRPAPGWPERRAAYQLWPALVHLRLFGESYRPMVEGHLATLGQ